MDDDPLTLARRCAEAMLSRDRASQGAGISVEDVGPGRASARMTVLPAMTNGHDICHGGYVFLLADTAFALACNSYGDTTLAQACDIVFAQPAHTGDELRADAVERLRFGRNGVYDVTVRRAGGEVVAEFRGRSRTLGTPLRLPEDPHQEPGGP